jgi:hypothetical protein
VMPRWPELFSTTFVNALRNSRSLPPLLSSLVVADEMGEATTAAVAAALGSSDVPMRQFAVEAILAAISRGTLRTELLTATCVRALDRGDLSASRIQEPLEQVILAGGMRSIWPTVLAISQWMCAQPKLPTGAASFLGFVRRYVTSDPELRVPPAVRALALNSGSSKSALEARAILSAAESTNGRP